VPVSVHSADKAGAGSPEAWKLAESLDRVVKASEKAPMSGRKQHFSKRKGKGLYLTPLQDATVATALRGQAWGMGSALPEYHL
jgi:hypothetical protein